jgi:hypothetical protein
MSDNSAIFDTLNELYLPESVIAGNTDRSVDGTALTTAKGISAATADKAYRVLVASENATSYSKLAELHRCPRAYELQELEANSPIAQAAATARSEEPNLHFCFGHAVGAGIQTFAVTQNLVSAQFAAFLAWRAPWDAEQVDKRGQPTGKSLAHALIAVEKFAIFWAQQLSDFEVVTLPPSERFPNGKPATELSFAIDFENGYKHFGHIDNVLKSKSTGRLAIWEGKTTGFEHVDEALYANSSQALSYSVVLDAIAAELSSVSGTDYEVLYIVYSSKSREFQLLPFGKSRAQRAEWLQDILLDQASISNYRKLEFFPKRGENCYNSSFRSRCRWFGNCTMKNSSLFPGVTLRRVEDVSEVESVDYTFTLSELLAAQQDRNLT